MVPIYGTCQWTAAGTFRYGAKAENQEFLGNFNPRFPSAFTGTDRHSVQNSYILRHKTVANWREVYVSLAVLIV
jgi:hypothetical protein